MIRNIYLHLQNCIPVWIVTLLVVFFLSWFTFSGAIMVAAGAAWSVLFWTGALVWSFFRALKGPPPVEDEPGDMGVGPRP